MRAFLVVLWCSVSVTAAASESKAQPEPDPWRVCHADVERLCPGSVRNEGASIRCLIPNESKLSPDCRKFFLARKREALKDWPCAEDAERLCKEAPNERGAVGSCLLKQREKLSAGCRAFHDQVAQKLRDHAKRVQQAGKPLPPEEVTQPAPHLPVLK
jgi:hypothetical protein